MVRKELVHEGVAKGVATDVIAQSLDVEIEPMLLLDRSGSMHWPTSPDKRNQVARMDFVREALGNVVAVLAAEDSQADEEDEGAGGLRTVAFGGDGPLALDNLNPGNLNEKWNQINFGGGTLIVPGWNELVDQYMEEFGPVPPKERPVMLVLVLTDGEAQDADEFANILRQVSGGVYIAVGIVGFGPEHDQTLASYNSISLGNPHVKVVSFESQTDPSVLSEELLRMLA